ncbi:hypothetical protein PHYC_01595 [Phycisphaerales bacterium]|nr:hypothetical protein PHYC_01595 [Phycisphaerales bacterium]
MKDIIECVRENIATHAQEVDLLYTIAVLVVDNETERRRLASKN